MPDINNSALAHWIDWDTPLCDRPRVISTFRSGYSHRSFLVCGPTNEGGELLFVVRHHSSTSRRLAMPAETEQHIMQLAGELAPRVVFRNDDVLITEFVDLPMWQPPCYLQRIGASLQQLHRLEVSPELPLLDLQQHCEHYRRQLDESVCDQQLYERALRRLIECERKYPELALCHNDPNPGNILVDRQDLCLIDWEYSNINSPWFDLASVAEFGNLAIPDVQLLCESYTAGNTQRAFDAIQAFRPIVRLVEWLWLLLQGSPQAQYARLQLQNLLERG